MTIVVVPNKRYTVEDVYQVACNEALVAIDDAVLQQADQLAVAVAQQRGVVYGLTTGVGDLAAYAPTEEAAVVQANILYAHAVGVGEPLSRELVRGAIFARLLTLSKGKSAARSLLLESLTKILNADVVPVVPALGSIGASDLTILAGIFAAFYGVGELEYNGERITAQELAQGANIALPRLQGREGLALINGNDPTTAAAALLTIAMQRFADRSTTTAALTIEARGATKNVFDPATQVLKPFASQMRIAEQLRCLLKGSDQIAQTYRDEHAALPQDPPSIKTIPNVIGTLQDAVERLQDVVEVELNGITDNPVFTMQAGEPIPLSSGHYLNVQLAAVLDTVAVLAAKCAQSSVARIQQLLNDQYNAGLPKYLIADTTNNSGFMITAYTAQAVLQEIQALLYPRAGFSATVANAWEDLASNAWNAVRNTQRVYELAERVLAIELALAVQGMALRRQQRATVCFGKQTEQVLARAKELCAAAKITLPVSADQAVPLYMRCIAHSLSSLLPSKEYL